MARKIRVLVGKPGLDGHDRGAKVVAAALRDAGMEVIYTGLHQSPEQIVEAALQEDVDVVALSILSGAHMTLFPEVLELMRRRGIDDKLLTGGGIISPEDMEALAKMGVGRLFGPGSSTQESAEYIRSWFVSKHGPRALAPAPATNDAAVAAPGRATSARSGRTARPRQRVRAARGKSKATPARAGASPKRRVRAKARPGAASRTSPRKKRSAASAPSRARRKAAARRRG